MERRIVQIAATEMVENGQYSRFIFALASDGTVFEMNRMPCEGEPVWAQVSPLPPVPDSF